MVRSERPVVFFTWIQQNGQDLVPGIGDAGDRLYLGKNAMDIAPTLNDEAPSKKSKK